LALVDLLPTTSLAASKREAREFLGAGAVSVNGEKAAAEARLTSANLLHGEIALLRRGKKLWHVVRAARG
jgi:tyrosyl-tRNA synthetase